MHSAEEHAKLAEQWSSLALYGFSRTPAGLFELRRCPFCSTPLSQRVELSQALATLAEAARCVSVAMSNLGES